MAVIEFSVSSSAQAQAVARRFGRFWPGLLGQMPGEGKEHVIERRSPQAQVGRLDPLGIKDADGIDQDHGPAFYRHLDRTDIVVDDHF
jgi:hypothetical protein